MDEAHLRRTALRDERLPALPAMLSDEALDMLAALPDVNGSIMAARPTQVHWQPGRSLAVRYDVTIDRTGREVSEQVVAWTGRQTPKAPVILGRGEDRVAIWRPNEDPGLPGFAIATDEAQTRALLDGLDVPPGRVARRVMAYRPLSRAVVAWTVGNLQLYAKVVRPGTVESLQARHRIIAPHLPVPRSHGWSPETGLIVLEGMPGVTMRAAFTDLSADLPAPAELAALLDRLPDPGDGRPARPAIEVAAYHAGLIGRLLPDVAPRVACIAADASQIGAPGPIVPVHGDFYEAQILVSGGRIAGLLDIDTAALGHRVDDWASMIGHLAVIEEMLPGPVRERLRDYGRALVAYADGQVDPARLRAAVATVILGLATGPFRVQSPDWPADTRRRIALAERWLGSARQAAGQAGNQS